MIFCHVRRYFGLCTWCHVVHFVSIFTIIPAFLLVTHLQSYELENQAALDEYLKNHQASVAKQGSEFGVQVVSRRTLVPQFKHFRQSKRALYL
jgi:hypothetical protein